MHRGASGVSSCGPENKVSVNLSRPRDASIPSGNACEKPAIVPAARETTFAVRRREQDRAAIPASQSHLLKYREATGDRRGRVLHQSATRIHTPASPQLAWLCSFPLLL